MVISFQLENVRNCLLKKGLVYTLRSKPHKEGKDWANHGRGTKKFADVKITRIQYEYNGLQEFVEQSGFQTLGEWLDVYWKLNPKTTPVDRPFLYKVELIQSASMVKGEK